MEDSNHSSPSKWEILARERNSRVIVCHTPDTYVLADLAKSDCDNVKLTPLRGL